MPRPDEKLPASALGEVSQGAHFLTTEHLLTDHGGDGLDPPAGEGILQVRWEGNRYKVLVGRPPSASSASAAKATRR